MLIAFILAQQRVTVKPVEGERGKGRLQRWHRASFTFLLCHRLSSTRFSLLLFDNWNRKIVQLCCTGCKRPKRMPWMKFSPISLCSALPPLSLFLSFFFFAFVCWFTRANYLYTILIVRHMCRGCFACTPRHDRGGTEFAPKTRRQPQEFLVLFVFAWYCLDAAPFGVVLAGYLSWLEEHPLVPLPVA